MQLSPSVITFLVLAGIAVVFIFGLFAMFARFYHKVEQGHALIINPFRGESKVTFTGGLVLPIINKAELMDISIKTIEIGGDWGVELAKIDALSDVPEWKLAVVLAVDDGVACADENCDVPLCCGVVA